MVGPGRQHGMNWPISIGLWYSRAIQFFLDGGGQSMTYTTTLTIGKSGIQTAPITIGR